MQVINFFGTNCVQLKKNFRVLTVIVKYKSDSAVR